MWLAGRSVAKSGEERQQDQRNTSVEHSNVLQARNYWGLTLSVMSWIEMLQCKTRPRSLEHKQFEPDPFDSPVPLVLIIDTLHE